MAGSLTVKTLLVAVLPELDVFTVTNVFVLPRRARTLTSLVRPSPFTVTLTAPPLLDNNVVLAVTLVIRERVVTATLRAAPAARVALACDLAKTRYLVPGLKPENVLLVCQPVVGAVVPLPREIAYSTL